MWLTAQAGYAVRCVRKQGRQSTGLPCLGTKGTVVLSPQVEHVTLVSGATFGLEAARFALQSLHRFGLFVNPFSAKKICSLAENTNSFEQSAHFSILSVSSIVLPS